MNGLKLGVQPIFDRKKIEIIKNGLDLIGKKIKKDEMVKKK